MLKENISEGNRSQEIKEQKMENNNTEELLKINYSDYFHKDNEVKENDGGVDFEGKILRKFHFFNNFFKKISNFRRR